MIKKIDFGKTNFIDLHQVFKLTNHQALEDKKARLFPCGNTENEVHTVSIFLASLSAVKEYREELFMKIGVKKIKSRNVNVHTYTEVLNIKTDDRPDGLIVITSGKHNPIIEWAGLVEVKVGENKINKEQINKYSDFAREIGINDIITVSNYLVTNPNQSPIKINKRNFKLYHWSWTYLKVTATHLIRTNSIEDSDHVYILKELRKYFDNHRKLTNYSNMGEGWKDAVSKIHLYEKKEKVSKEIIDVIVKSYSQEEKDISLQLTDNSNHYIDLVAKENRLEKIESSLQNSKSIISTYIVNQNKKNTFDIEIDFIRRQVKCNAKIIINKGKAQAQTSTLIKLFENDSGWTENIFIKAVYSRNKFMKHNVSLSDLIEQKNNSEFYSILDKSYGDEVKHFEVFTIDSLNKDIQSVKNFITKLENIAKRFLNQVIENKC